MPAALAVVPHGSVCRGQRVAACGEIEATAACGHSAALLIRRSTGESQAPLLSVTILRYIGTPQSANLLGQEPRLKPSRTLSASTHIHPTLPRGSSMRPQTLRFK